LPHDPKHCPASLWHCGLNLTGVLATNPDVMMGLPWEESGVVRVDLPCLWDQGSAAVNLAGCGRDGT